MHTIVSWRNIGQWLMIHIEAFNDDNTMKYE